MTHPPPGDFPAVAFAAHAVPTVAIDHSKPLRPKASPRLTPTHSGQSTPSAEAAEPEALSSGQESPIRGRTLFVLIPPSGVIFANLSSRAGFGSVGTGLDHVSRRLMNKDSFDFPGEMDPSDLETFPALENGSNVTGTLSSVTVRDSADWSGFLGHRDTFALRDMRRCISLSGELPDSFFQRLLRYIDFDTYLSVRLSCRSWSWAITCARPIKFISSPPVQPLPTAVLQQIYVHLSPVDFNAARHTRWSWMDASLDYQLLTRMLERGSWGGAARADLALYEESGAGRFAGYEWLLSKRLATECSLRPDWTGNGLDQAIKDASTSYLTRTSKPSDGRCAFESFSLVSEIDFSTLNANQDSGDDEIYPVSTLQFTSSVCGKYLLVTRNCTIYLYFLYHGASATYHSRFPNPVEALTHIVCPYRVLAVSMDTSSHRFAVAALLEGRVGLICDLHVLGAALRRRDEDAHPLYPVSSVCWESQVSVAKSGHLNNINDHSFPSFPAISPWDGFSRRTSSEYSTGSKSPSQSQPLPSPSIDRTVQSCELGRITLYYDLCSAIDPPLSVAICPQRQCVAFGCSTAVELHWVDALTGQRLNRGFPISPGAGVLYFLPIREDERHLRLIGSDAVSSACGGVFEDKKESEVKSSNGAERKSYHTQSGSNYYCNAIPLGDGSHVLFTNPSTGDICLGIENTWTTTRIDASSMKLDTIVIFEGPLSAAEIVEKSLPRLYEVGRDLKWGPRVVVGFGDEIWVFAVPGDWLKGPRTGKDDVPVEEGRPIMKIGGIRVGMVERLVRVGIRTDGGGALVWGISAVGLMREWWLGASGNGERWVAESGSGMIWRFDDPDDKDRIFGTDTGSKTIDADVSCGDGNEAYDADGDVIMSGTERHNRADVCPQSESHAHGTVRRDADGDVIMSDAGIELAPESSALDPDQDLDVQDLDEGYASGDSDGGDGDEVSDEGYGADDLDEGYFSGGESTLEFHPAFLGGVGDGDGRRDGREHVWESSWLEVQVLGCSG